MRKLLYLVPALLVAACFSRGQPLGSVIADPWTLQWSESQPCQVDGGCTFAAPYFDAGVASTGASLRGVDGIRLVVCAPSGQTLTGAGTMTAYFCDSFSRQCPPNSGLNQSVTATGACQAFPDFRTTYVSAQADTVEFAATQVGVSGTDGGALVEYIYTHLERGGK